MNILNKLKFVTGSEFFIIEDGKILFNGWDQFFDIENYLNNHGEYNKYMRNLIANIAKAEWYGFIFSCNDKIQLAEAYQQIELWDKYAKGNHI
jgi:hypothetical protein